MKVFVKNMVCHRCILAVEQIFESMNYTLLSIQLGEVEVKEEISTVDLDKVSQQLVEIGFELLNDKERQVVTKIKSLLIELLQKEQVILETPLSLYLTTKTQLDYLYLTQLFSQMESTTIEQYFIALKIEKVKELLLYDELSLKEIAFRLRYSSVAHLSTQFKKMTGMTPTAFKQMSASHRTQIDRL